MRTLLFAGLVFAASGCLGSAAVRQFPWIRSHTTKKADAAQTRVAYHGVTTWSSEGRLHFPTAKETVPTDTRSKARAAKGTR